MPRKISDLTVDEFTDLVSDIIDQRIEAIFASDGELRADFAEELKRRRNNPNIVDMNTNIFESLKNAE